MISPVSYFPFDMNAPKEYLSARALGMSSGSHLDDLSDPVGVVCISRLKTFAGGSLPAGYPLREVLLSDKDYLSVREFLAKIGVWLRLLDLRQGVNMRTMGPTGPSWKKRGEADENGSTR